MNANKHTATPWSVEQPMDEEFVIVQSGLEAYEWQFIATCPITTPADGGFPRQKAKANAAFIVAACNNHQRLIDLLLTGAQDLQSHQRLTWKDDVIRALAEITHSPAAMAGE